MSDWFKRRICNWPMATILGLSFFLVYLIPPEWIRGIPGMNAYLLWIPEHVPGIKSCIHASNFWGIASIYYPLMFLVSFLGVVEIWLISVGTGPGKWHMSFINNPWKYIFAMSSTLLFMPGFFYLCFVIGIGTIQFNSMPHNESKFFMALLGPVVAGTIFWVFLGAFLRTIFTSFFKVKYQ